MNVTTYLSDISHQFIQVPLSSYPAVLRDCYIHYLWNYQPNSWVARVASACRVLAILVSLPIIILALLDISSYGIARTLGVIDDVKASTSDTAPIHNVPSIHVIPSASSTPCTTDSDSNDSVAAMSVVDSRKKHTPKKKNVYPTLGREILSSLGVSQPRAFYASDEGSDFKLSGVGVFSPATSPPPSPVSGGGGGKTVGEELDIGLRQRVLLGGSNASDATEE